jgi:NTP pyrophosphatase (non-canonical NTP hydrolase)
MNLRNSNYYDMFIRVQAVLNNHATAWENNAFIVAQKDKLDRQLIELDGLSEEVYELQSAKAQKKKRLKAELTQKLQELQGALIIYASTQQDDDLKKKVGMNRSTIGAADDKTLRTVGNSIISRSEQYSEALANFGVTAGEVAAVKELHTGYSELVGKPLADISELNAVKRKQNRVAIQTNAMLREAVDPIMLSYRTRDQQFYDAYTLARTIIDRKARLKQNGEGEEEKSNSESGIPSEE